MARNTPTEVIGHCSECDRKVKITVPLWYARGVLKLDPEAWCPDCFPGMFQPPVVCKWRLVEKGGQRWQS